MEFEDAVRLLNLAAPLFKSKLKVCHTESGNIFKVNKITVCNSPDGEPEICMEI